MEVSEEATSSHHQPTTKGKDTKEKKNKKERKKEGKPKEDKKQTSKDHKHKERKSSKKEKVTDASAVDVLPEVADVAVDSAMTESHQPKRKYADINTYIVRRQIKTMEVVSEHDAVAASDDVVEPIDCDVNPIDCESQLSQYDPEGIEAASDAELFHGEAFIDSVACEEEDIDAAIEKELFLEDDSVACEEVAEEAEKEIIERDAIRDIGSRPFGDDDLMADMWKHVAMTRTLQPHNAPLEDDDDMEAPTLSWSKAADTDVAGSKANDTDVAGVLADLGIEPTASGTDDAGGCNMLPNHITTSRGMYLAALSICKDDSEDSEDDYADGAIHMQDVAHCADDGAHLVTDRALSSKQLAYI
jgi:hypothetical protein